MSQIDLAIAFLGFLVLLLCVEGWEDVQRYRRCRRANRQLKADQDRRLWRL